MVSFADLGSLSAGSCVCVGGEAGGQGGGPELSLLAASGVETGPPLTPSMNDSAGLSLIALPSLARSRMLGLALL